MTSPKLHQMRTGKFGHLPSDWKICHLGESAQISGRIGWKGLKQDEYTEDGPFLVAGKHIKAGRILWESCDHIEAARYQESPEIALQSGDVIFSKDGSLGNPALLDEMPGPATINSTMMLVRPLNQSLSSRFLYHVLKSDYFENLVRERVSGSSIPHIFQRDMKDFQFPLPPIPEQEKIAAIFTAVDDKLAVIARQIEDTRMLKQGLMQTLFNRGVGTLGADGRWLPHSEFNDSELGELPIGWEVVEIQSLATVIRGASPRPQGDPRYYGGGIPRLMGADVTRDGKWVTPQIDFLTEEGAKRSRPCPKGTLTIICSGDVGVPSFLAVDACIHDGFLALVNVDESKTTKDFLYHVIFSLKEKFDSSATHGGVFTNLTTGILKVFKLPLPSLNEQVRIASILEAIDDKLGATKTKYDSYLTLKRGLMKKLLTGEWRVTLDTQQEAVLAA